MPWLQEKIKWETVRFGEALKHFDVDFLRVRMMLLSQTIKSSSPITSSFFLNCIKKQDRNNFRQSFKGELLFATRNKGKKLTWSQQKDLELVVLVLREEKLHSGKVTTSMTTSLHFDVRLHFLFGSINLFKPQPSDTKAK